MLSTLGKHDPQQNNQYIDRLAEHCQCGYTMSRQVAPATLGLLPQPDFVFQ